MQVHCINVSEHVWVGGSGPRGVRELPAGGICASQGTFSSLSLCLQGAPFLDYWIFERKYTKNHV